MTISLEKPVTEYETSERAAWIDGLRQIADLLETHPGIPLPAPVSLTVHDYDDDAKLTLAAVRRLIGGKWEKRGTSDYFWLHNEDTFAPHQIDLMTLRARVCERVVTGTETVEIPDPQAPLVTVERDIVTWVCSHLLEDEGVA